MSEIQILRIDQVIQKTSLSKTSIYELIKRGEFPSPKPLVLRRVGWLSTDIDEWILSKFQEQSR